MNTKQPTQAFRLLIIGDEILSGRREDKHLVKVIELLGKRGLALASCEYVGDDRESITDALNRAFASGDVVFSTGGIGATPDDHTRQCAAAALEVPLIQHPEATDILIERLKEMFAERNAVYDPRDSDNVHRLNMAVFPSGARIIPNPYNKVAGFSCFNGDYGDLSVPQGASTGAPSPARGSEERERGGIQLSAAEPPQGASVPSGGSERSERGGIHFVPGFPVMAWPMIEWVLDTYYTEYHTKVPQVERSVIVFGAMEATLTPLMEQIESDFPGVKVFSLPSVDHPEYGRHIDLGVKGHVEATVLAFEALKAGVLRLNGRIGPEMVR